MAMCFSLSLRERDPGEAGRVREGKEPTGLVTALTLSRFARHPSPGGRGSTVAEFKRTINQTQTVISERHLRAFF